jgi:hypothetical protein
VHLSVRTSDSVSECSLSAVWCPESADESCKSTGFDGVQPIFLSCSRARQRPALKLVVKGDD